MDIEKARKIQKYAEWVRIALIALIVVSLFVWHYTSTH